MGQTQYERSLSGLDTVVNWALSEPVDSLSDSLSILGHSPLVTVGSGGSLTAARMAAMLHEAFLGVPAKAVTPLELAHCGAVRGGSVMLLSARGRNADILRAFDTCVESECKCLLAICGTLSSPLSRKTHNRPDAWCYEFETPTGRDSFLAVGSLLSTCILLTRAYSQLTGSSVSLHLDSALALDYPNALSVECEGFLGLSGGWGMIPLYDLECKLAEAALAHVSVSDFRNFGHGRHVWLSTRPHNTGVIILSTPEVAEIARSTVALLPPGTRKVVIDTPHQGPAGALDLLMKTFAVVGKLGYLRRRDPGRPGVAEFGRRLYRLGFEPKKKKYALKEYWTRRKLDAAGDVAGSMKSWYEQGLEVFLQRLNGSRVSGLVLDMDGTLLDDRRSTSLPAPISAELIRLLRRGFGLGIATGRGRSAQTVLQASLPREFWSRVLVGYYNGSLVLSLDANVPAQTNLGTWAQAVMRALEDSDILADIANVTVRTSQVSIEWRGAPDRLTGILKECVLSKQPGLVGSSVLRSGHSVDIVPPGVSKVDIIKALASRCHSGALLCIADSGQMGGNDYELLSTPVSLSCDKVSVFPDRCWNLAPPGYRNASATLLYLKALRDSGMFDPGTIRDVWS